MYTTLVLAVNAFLYYCFIHAVVPSILVPPVNFTYFVNETDPVTFTCSATGIPPPQITWMRNGVVFSNTQVTFSDPTMPELYLTDGGNIFFVSRNLTLDSTMDADSGTYTCLAFNGNAVTPSVTHDFELFVNGMHRFIQLVLVPSIMCGMNRAETLL